MYSYFSIKSASGFLQAEVVKQLLVGQVAAFKGEVVSSVLQAVTHGEVV